MVDTAPRIRRCRPDQGQTTVVSAAVLAIVVVVGLALAQVARGAVDRAGAQRAADAAALAAAVRVDPDDADRIAGVVAEANAATVVATRRVADVVVVTVRVGAARASAAARPVTR